MKSWRIISVSIVALVGLTLAGCVGTAPKATVDVPETAKVMPKHIIYDQATWSGEVHVVRPVIVTRTASLTLQPGTKVYFDIPEPQPGKDREPWILVQGNLVALGAPESPIVFTSVRLTHNELDDMIHVQNAKEAHFRHCVFERGPWALHLHETNVDVFSCVFRNNYGGVRFQGDRVVLRDNLFEDNRIGVRCLRTSPVIEQNVFRGNLTGIFFREGVTNAVLSRNNFDNREYDLKLGETQVEDVDAARNWWQVAEKEQPEKKIFDGSDTDGVGFVVTDPVLPEPWGTEPEK